MGLFSNKKKLCPICDSPTPRLLATKIEGTPICGDCAVKIDLPNGAINDMSMDAFREYLAYYDENEGLRNMFSETYRYSFGWLSGCIVLDTDNRLFRLQDMNSAFVMQGTNLKQFRILEGSRPLYEGKADALECYDTGIEDRVNALTPQITQYLIQKREIEFMERMERRQEERDGDNDGMPSRRHIQPLIDVPVPFQKFNIEMTLDHKYWKTFHWEKSGPSFSREYPSVDAYLNDYRASAEDLHALALNLMQIINPNAPEINANDAVSAVAQAMPIVNASSAVSAADEIKKYKELLDMGIITEKEFTAKKRQLLGI